MATLTFSGLPSGVVQTSMDNVTYTEATSPITLVDGMYIWVSSSWRPVGQPVTYVNSVYVNENENDVWSNSRENPFILTDGGALNYTTSSTQTATSAFIAKYVEQPKTTLDLSTLSDITDGAHTVKVKAKADGYRDSEFSNEVSYTKTPSGRQFSEMLFITDDKTYNNGADFRFYNASNEEIAYIEFWWDKPNKVVKGRVNGGDTTDSNYNNGALRLSVNFKAVRCTVRPWGDEIRSAYAGYDFQDNRVSIPIGQTTEVDVSNWESTFAVSMYS